MVIDGWSFIAFVCRGHSAGLQGGWTSKVLPPGTDQVESSPVTLPTLGTGLPCWFETGCRPQAYDEMKENFVIPCRLYYQTKYGHRNHEGGKPSARNHSKAAAGAVAKSLYHRKGLSYVLMWNEFTTMPSRSISPQKSGAVAHPLPPPRNCRANGTIYFEAKKQAIGRIYLSCRRLASRSRLPCI